MVNAGNAAIRQKRLVGNAPDIELGSELSPELLHNKLLSGEAHYVGTVSQHGEIHDYYRLDVSGKTTYIYSVR